MSGEYNCISISHNYGTTFQGENFHFVSVEKLVYSDLE